MKHYASRLDFWATMYGEASKMWLKYHVVDNYAEGMRYHDLANWIHKRMERAMK